MRAKKSKPANLQAEQKDMKKKQNQSEGQLE